MCQSAFRYQVVNPCSIYIHVHIILLHCIHYFVESVGNLPFLRDETYIPDIHKEIMSEQPWSNQGLKATAQLAWGLALRQLSQFYTPNGMY